MPPTRSGMGRAPLVSAALAQRWHRVRVPADLPAGAWVLSWRMDQEESNQIWQSCADLTVETPARRRWIEPLGQTFCRVSKTRGALAAWVPIARSSAMIVTGKGRAKLLAGMSAE